MTDPETAITGKVQFITWRDSGRGENHVKVRVNGFDVGKLTMDDRQLVTFSNLFAPSQNGRNGEEG